MASHRLIYPSLAIALFLLGCAQPPKETPEKQSPVQKVIHEPNPSPSAPTKATTQAPQPPQLAQEPQKNRPNTKDAFTELLVSKGLDPNIEYPYWPLVYDAPTQRLTYNNPRIPAPLGKEKRITTSVIVTNFGDSAISNIQMRFDYFGESNGKREFLDARTETVQVIYPGEQAGFYFENMDLQKERNWIDGPFLTANGIKGDPRY
jgi:hypothetical protein